VLKRTLLILVVVLALVLAACGGGEAKTCDDITDQTLDLMQELINDVEAELGDMSVQELIDTGGDLPSIDRFEKDAAKIDERAGELGCTQTEITADIASRVGELEATTPIGTFLIQAIRDGGL
jgi:hypothetical protein